MGNGKEIERLFKLQTKVNGLVMEGKRCPSEVSDALQKILVQKPPKFRHLSNLGTIEVPSGYEGDKYFTYLLKKYGGGLDYYDPGIADEDFSDSCIARPGDRFRVDGYLHVGKEPITFLESVNYLWSTGAELIGAHGAGLVFELLRNNLPDKCVCVSLTAKDASSAKVTQVCLAKDKGSNHALTYGSYGLRVCSKLPQNVTLLSFRST